MSTEWITRAEAGRRLGVTAMAVTKFCRSGMPHRHSDGRVCWPDAQYWSDWYRCPESSGTWHQRHPHPDAMRRQRERAEKELRRPWAERWRRLREVKLDAASVANQAQGRL
jgi:hypothetical protein